MANLNNIVYEEILIKFPQINDINKLEIAFLNSALSQ